MKKLNQFITSNVLLAGSLVCGYAVAQPAPEILTAVSDAGTGAVTLMNAFLLAAVGLVAIGWLYSIVRGRKSS